jgi:ABC-2 type transport system permease protein
MGIGSLAQSVLRASAGTKADPEVAAILTANTIDVDSLILDKQGRAYNPFEKMIIPGIFLVLLFVIFILTGNQTLVATTEEKENRIAEMILTTIDAKTLIIGKIIALVVLGFIQIIALLTPMILIYFGGIKLDLIPPFLSSILSGAKAEFWPIFFGANILVWGFLLMTGFTVLIGSLFPTAQDAAQFYGPIILAMIIPVYFAPAIFTGAKSIIVQILTFFPLSAPFTLLMRNTAGNLNVVDGLIGLIILITSTIVIMLIAVRAFRFGVFEYSGRLSLKQILIRSKKFDARA